METSREAHGKYRFENAVGAIDRISRTDLKVDHYTSAPGAATEPEVMVWCPAIHFATDLGANHRTEGLAFGASSALCDIGR
jgi:hypothetical protein